MHNKRFNINPTKAWWYWRIMVHSLVLLILLSLPISLAMKLGFCLTVVLLFFVKQHEWTVAGLAHEAKDLWRLYPIAGEKEYVQLLPLSYISDSLLILRFKDKTLGVRKPPLLLLRAQFTQQDWRYLQMLVRGKPRD